MDLISCGVLFCLVFLISAIAISSREDELPGAAICCLIGAVLSLLLAVLGVVMEVLL